MMDHLDRSTSHFLFFFFAEIVIGTILHAIEAGRTYKELRSLNSCLSPPPLSLFKAAKVGGQKQRWIDFKM